MVGLLRLVWLTKFLFSPRLIPLWLPPPPSGLLYTAVGLLRLGWLTNFLSHTVVSGFMSGACIVIALSQVGTCRCKCC